MSDIFSGPVEKLAGAQPDRTDNAAARAARDNIVLHTKLATPGNKEGPFFTKGVAFREIFFPGARSGTREKDVGALTHLGGRFFSDLSVAMLCQQMGSCTTHLRPQIMFDRISQDLVTLNEQLAGDSYFPYLDMLWKTQNPIAQAMSQFPTSPDRVNAGREYVAGLTSEAWVNFKRTQDANGKWIDPEWELYHHWIKLVMLGAELDLVDDTIGQIAAMGLHIPANCGAKVWHRHAPWLDRPIGGADAADAAPAMRKTDYRVIDGTPIRFEEANAFDFTSRGAPGYKYRRSGS